MDETLKRLLDAELRAEKMVEEAKARRQSITERALEDARNMERQFLARTPEIHGAFMEKAEARASQGIAELKRRYDERNMELRKMAEKHEQEAVEAALAIVLEPEKG